MSTKTVIATTPAPTARVPLNHRRTLFVRAMEAYSRRAYGAVLTPGLIMLHHRKVLLATVRHESAVARWHAVDPTHQALAVLGAAATIGCAWCLDFGYWEYHHRAVDPAKLRAVTDWRESSVYTDSERAVLAFAEATTVTPPTVTDAMVDGLRSWFDDRQIVELTALVALENSRSRINAAMGLTGQGFRDTCDTRGSSA